MSWFTTASPNVRIYEGRTGSLPFFFGSCFAIFLKVVSKHDDDCVERSHRSDQDEFYQLLSYKDDRDLHIKLAEWEQFYNFSRPHDAHLGKTPYEAMREKLL